MIEGDSVDVAVDTMVGFEEEAFLDEHLGVEVGSNEGIAVGRMLVNGDGFKLGLTE